MQGQQALAAIKRSLAQNMRFFPRESYRLHWLGRLHMAIGLPIAAAISAPSGSTNGPDFSRSPVPIVDLTPDLIISRRIFRSNMRNIEQMGCLQKILSLCGQACLSAWANSASIDGRGRASDIFVNRPVVYERSPLMSMIVILSRL